ncbi:PIR Superfamily Protein [Plasmodium ovale curtisi]|uniref:PIR Superfamily Protein n=1 Tax=Plasmodium ovale curtisi TaxID=864141 RepID=A0A1A8X9L4_PLAOA|nr:PIR Superfamily Protein [Plasmodium ovale curtisi]
MIELKKFEDDCPLMKFIKRINIDIIAENYDDDSDFQRIIKSEDGTIRKVASILYKNFNLIDNDQRITKGLCCSYLNFWLHKQKSRYITSRSMGIEQWEQIENLWNFLQDFYSSIFHCKRENDLKAMDEREKKMDLMIYCENRDYFKNICGINKERKLHNANYCSILSQYTDKYYKEFYEKNTCLNGEVKEENRTSHISEYCTLYDMPKTFPVYDLQTGDYSEKHNSRESISICQSVHNTQDSFQEIEVLEPPTKTASSTYREPWKSYTSLGSLLRSFLTKKKTVLQCIEDKTENELLEQELEYNDYNSEKKKYNFSYHSVQI